ncbi:MAG TPA: hypothetical protein VFB67_06810 [Candidatus Polarisedimenticolaceae bacterium]|nr:hypothetical protein [Candidatus Polarisedimenticolaceae bacterium]
MRESRPAGTLAAIATLIAGLVIGGTGFITYAKQVASDNNDAMLRIAAKQQQSGKAEREITTAAPVALTMLAPLGFVVGTPLGWLSAYLFLTGGIRTVAALVAREQRGDPLIGLVRRLAARWKTRQRRTAEEAEMEALAGPAVADRVVAPERVGLSGCDLVVVASRPKPDWTPGTILDCGDRWLQVGEAVETTMRQGLRVLYPLSDAPAMEVFRRVIPYELPATPGAASTTESPGG